jgi:sugar phosphate isomerase/epimerase
VSNPDAFGISTHLVHSQRLSREHLLDIASAGFRAIELRATPSHFAYGNPANIADLQQWLAESGLQLASVHGPIGELFAAGRLTPPWSLAAADQHERERAVDETLLALQIARRIAFGVLVVHLGAPRSQGTSAGDSSREAARRSVEAIAEAARPLGVRVALEVLPNELSRSGSLTHFVEEVIEASGVGICLDLGHAHLEGDVIDAIETVSEHLFAVDLHDNRGRHDDHVLPFEGAIDWPGAMTAIQKVGYDGPLMIEVGARGAIRDALAAARKARERLGRLMTL